MRVITYVSSVADDAPERYRAVAFIMHDDGSIALPRFHAPDKHQARAQAQAWLDAEVEATKAKHGLTEERLAAIKAGRERARALKAAKAEPVTA